MVVVLVSAALSLLIASANAQCPMTGALPVGHPPVSHRIPGDAPVGFYEAVRAMDWEAVQADLREVLSTSQDHWPADYGNYGPEMIRLAWHNAGSYRTSDGRGGADGAHQRFEPERSWEDNTNLDKARDRLTPLKLKYGLGLSWGDLIQLAGYVALESMGTPLLGFCAGRVDDDDGFDSELLGPTEAQEAYLPCEVNGECESPLGATTIGLIYVNPEGPMGVPDPVGSVVDVRDTFARMAMNDSETVALIGGGHAFGKTHGACPNGAGPSPVEDPKNPWPGLCGTGIGVDAWTSGFEGPWTTNPTRWDNEYFKNLLANKWEVHMGPGGHYQWRTNETSPVAPAADGNGTQDIMMLTSDISLLNDAEYKKLVQEFAGDIEAFDLAFMHAWYKLTTRDMGPVQRCLGGDMVPAAQPWQYPLPAPLSPGDLADFDAVKSDIAGLIAQKEDARSGLVRLAWQCANTYRRTDYLGGCNGARIRLAPQNAWPVNEGLDSVLEMLAPIKTAHGEGLSWADLIVLAGNTAVEDAAKAAGEKDFKLNFCPGRTDAMDGDLGAEYLEPKVSGAFDDSIADFLDMRLLMGVEVKEYVALVAGAHMLSGTPPGYRGRPTNTLDNKYFATLLTEYWEEYTVDKEHTQYRAKTTDGSPNHYALSTDLMLRWDPELNAASQFFATDNAAFLEHFARSWTGIMNADRFDGPTKSLCV